MAYSPRIGGNLPQGFAAQLTSTGIDGASLATTPIELLALDGSGDVLSHGTGFFWRAQNHVYLITARHVLSGLNPFTDEPMDGVNAFLPRECRVFPSVRLLSGDVARVEYRTSVVDSSGQPIWREDPEFAALRTDIAALFVPPAPMGPIVCLNEALSPEEIISFVGGDCSVLGYPNRNYEGLLTPIWRRAALASEPMVAIDAKPMFLVDASTAPGFSGAPVLRRHHGPLPVLDGQGGVTVDISRVLTTNLIGVYAGRLQNRLVGGEVPFVFYANRLPAIIGNARTSVVQFGLGDMTGGGLR